MLERFGVWVFSEYLNEKEKEISVRSFSDFYHSITPKHQKRARLIWFSNNQADRNVSLRLMDMYEIPEANIQMANNENKISLMNSAKLCIHPSTKYFNATIPEALSHGLPVITLEEFNTTDYIDLSCGIAIEPKIKEQLITDFTYYLDMLYFDDEVLKVLEKGAYDQYEKKFGWGLKEFRRGNI